MTEKRFYDKKFVLVVDLRCTDDNDAINAGHNVTDTKSGVQLIITKASYDEERERRNLRIIGRRCNITEGSFSGLKLTNK